MWTHFFDMHSGGSQKEQWANIFIEAAKDVAVVVFYNRFGHNPSRVTCTCCGDDYSITEYETLEEATNYQRAEMAVEEYAAKDDVLVVRAADISAGERTGSVPQQGFVWVE